MVLIAFPPNIVAAAPIILTNSQSAATPAPFQQMVSVDMSKYSSYAAPNLQNIEFFYTDGTLIPSWLESGSSSTTAIWWLSIANGIGANSSLTVYMGFALQSVNLFDGITVGEAPQLSGTYGQYDNGAKVFSFYDNFKGTTLSSVWSVPSGSNYQVNNGFIGEPSGGSTTAVYNANVQETGSIIAEWELNLSSTVYPDATDYSYFQLNRYSVSSNMHFLGIQGIDDIANNGSPIASESIAGSGIHSFGIRNDGATVEWFYDGNVLYSETSAVVDTDYLSLGWAYNGQPNNFPTIYWVRVRAYPPSGTMPGVTADPPLDACAGPTYPLIVAQIVKPSLAPKGVSPKANTGSLFILQNACPAPAETLAQAQQQLANQKYLTPPSTTTQNFTITLLGA